VKIDPSRFEIPAPGQGKMVGLGNGRLRERVQNPGGSIFTPFPCVKTGGGF